MQQTSYRAWLLFGCVPFLSCSVSFVWRRVLSSWRHPGAIQVGIDSLQAGTLFRAVTECIEQVAETNNETCSCEVEGLTAYDKTLGRTQVLMRHWGKAERVVNLELAQGRKLAVGFRARRRRSLSGSGSPPII